MRVCVALDADPSNILGVILVEKHLNGIKRPKVVRDVTKAFYKASIRNSIYECFNSRLTKAA